MDAQTCPEILLVEDAKFFRSVLKSQIEKQLGFTVSCAENFEQAKNLIEEKEGQFFLALLDLNLPDAPDGEIVDMVVAKEIPTIVFSAQYNEELRENLMKEDVIDYVVKDSPASIEYVISTVKRLHKNQFIKVLMVDDSQSARYQMQGLLKKYNFNVLEAADGFEALKILDENPDTLLVLVDYNMPQLDGFELTKKIRTHFSKRDLCVIGVSTYGNHALSAKFIKVGANDFITKPFLNEEFFCRISQNIEMLEHIQALQDTLITDYLTGLRNRRYLFERGETMREEFREKGGYLIAAMIDVDNFKAINDEYGHDGGDQVLRHLAKVMRRHFERKGIVARFGGEEFCILMLADNVQDIEAEFDSLCMDVAENPIELAGQRTRVTISIGVSWKKTYTMEDLIKAADVCLYQAKEAGRNRVCIDQ